MNARPGIPLGRVLGVPVWLAPSWFVVALVVVVVFAPSVEAQTTVAAPATYLVAALYAVLLLVSVLVHELAHAAVARSLGLPVTQIVLNLWGGHTQFADEAPAPGRSALVAVVGPLANAGLALLGWLALDLTPDGVPRLLLVGLVVTNAIVAVFNLAPGLPLDGGRVVEAAIWAVSGNRSTGTLVAGWCGRVMAGLVLLWALGRPVLQGSRPTLVSVVWSVMIAALLWQGASSAIAVSRVRRSADRMQLARFVEPAVTSGADEQGWARFAPDDPTHLVALDAQRRPVGVLTAASRTALQRSPTPPPPGTPLSAVMTVLDPVVALESGAGGGEVLNALASRPAHTYLVVDRAGQVVGLADGQTLADALTGTAPRRP